MQWNNEKGCARIYQVRSISAGRAQRQLLLPTDDAVGMTPGTYYPQGQSICTIYSEMKSTNTGTAVNYCNIMISFSKQSFVTYESSLHCCRDGPWLLYSYS
jgi:hypothetical protein